ncbi:MAG: arsenate reductase [Candidatus Latescibacterota bacterium]|jgi:arsenate reductase
MLHPGSFAKLGLDIDDYNTADALVALLVEHPEVMNRPIVVYGNKAVIARPAERVNEILD